MNFLQRIASKIFGFDETIRIIQSHKVELQSKVNGLQTELFSHKRNEIDLYKHNRELADKIYDMKKQLGKMEVTIKILERKLKKQNKDAK